MTPTLTHSLLLLTSLTIGTAYAAPELPLADGQYVFQQRYAEHPQMQGINLDTEIKQGRISLTNNDSDGVFPLGLIDEGELYWHARSGHWIIIYEPKDKEAKDVGGCSDGPAVVDLENKIYWTC
ncbi:hypothetical protein [Thalassolituus sp. UBA2009]|uniref:hypothetical protein n=1 Tax=Thalassolituus sp. UBA2009 TaxID=1947658 RepID=UPI0025805AAE|nr:hypothetical protein [Thalassolituus sp. UBA2009]